MEESLVRSPAWLQLSLYCATLASVALWEYLSPRRPLTHPRGARWLSNLTILLIDTALLRWLGPVTGVALATVAAERDWGLLHRVDVPFWPAVLATVVLLDFRRYVEHFLLHKVAFLWRLHRLHHSDQDFDLTTQLRFHPFEALLSAAVVAALVVVLGLPPAGVLLYAVLAATIGFIQHGNGRYPLWLDSLARLLIVTPDMHRVHHSVQIEESNSNFGVVLSWWDKLFGTYCAQPSLGHDRMAIGLTERRDAASTMLSRMLADPFSSYEPTAGAGGSRMRAAGRREDF